MFRRIKILSFSAICAVGLTVIGGGTAFADTPTPPITGGQIAGTSPEIIDTGCTTNSIPANDDGSSPSVDLPFAANFFGTTYGSLFVNNNGNVTFGAPQSTFTPFTLNSSVSHPIIAPFFGDVDTRGGVSHLVTYGSTTIGGHQAFCVNWDQVGYFGQHSDKLNSFQLVMIDRSDIQTGDFDIEFNYSAIMWETGDASHGSNGFGGSSAGAGFSSSNGNSATFFQIPGSIMPGSFLDSNPSGLAHTSLNSTLPGRYLFAVHNGQNSGTGAFSGLVKNQNGDPIGNVPVQACSEVTPTAELAATDGVCITGFSSSNGHYSIFGAGVGTWDLTASGPAGSSLLPGRAGPIALTTGQSVVQDLILTGPTPPPMGTTLTERGTTADGIPVVYWQDPLTLSTVSTCHGGMGSYSIFQGANQITHGVLPETSTPGTYATTIPALYPAHGDVIFNLSVTGCGAPDNHAFAVYIDPSGTVVDQDGHLVTGASVTLYRADSLVDPFVPVPDGSSIMDASNRNNPSITDSSGSFAWNVTAGFYKVRATKDGCTSLNDQTVPFAESAVYPVPPPALNIVLTLRCTVANPPPLYLPPAPVDTTPPVISCPPDVTAPHGSVPSLGSATATDTADPSPSVTNDAPSAYPDGATVVKWTATDTSGNSATCNQTVNISPAPLDTTSITNQLSTTHVDYGEAVTVTAVLKDTTLASSLGSAPVLLQELVAGRWTDVTTKTTDSSGSAAVILPGIQSLSYRWLYAGDSTHASSMSPALSLTVTPVISAVLSATHVHAGQLATMSGTVSAPVLAGSTIYLQRLVHGVWVNAAAQHLAHRNGSASFSFPMTLRSVGDYHLRVYLAPSSLFTAASSAAVVLRVTD